jgi:hypothetical protein
VPIPFRWDVAHKHHLGGLLDGERAAADCRGFKRHLLACCARVVTLSGDSDLVFVGRSPENIHDLLLGLLWDTSWRGRIFLLQFSLGNRETSAVQRRHPASLGAFRAYLDRLGMSPTKLTVRERPIALVDLVCSGNTLHQLLLLLHDWALEEKADWPAMQRKIRVVAIVRPEEPSLLPNWKRRPRPWLWRDYAPWVEELLESGALKEAPMERMVWSHLADYQDKTTRSYTPDHWGDPTYSVPFRENERHLRALRLAHWLFETARQRAWREQFAALIAEEREMCHGWLRRLVIELRSGSGANTRRRSSEE